MDHDSFSDGDDQPGPTERRALPEYQRSHGDIMTNGANGQLVRFYGDGFTTIQNNATQVTVAGSDLPLAANRIYQFIRQNSVWYQL
jgi:hypothetical protein